jgi:hypothetical protein
MRHAAEMNQQRLDLRLYEHYVAMMKIGKLSERGEKFIAAYIKDTAARKLRREAAKNSDLRGAIAASESRTQSIAMRAQLANDPSVRSIATSKPNRKRFKPNEASEMVAIGGVLDSEQVNRLLGVEGAGSDPLQAARERAKRQLESIRRAAR